MNGLNTMGSKYEVGQLVRVAQRESMEHRRALVATVNSSQGQGTVDVVYVGAVFQLKKRDMLGFASQFGLDAALEQGDSEEESEVTLDRLAPVLPFEVENARKLSFSQAILGSLKASGVEAERTEDCALELVQLGTQRLNQLAKFRDFEAAVEEIVLTISALCTFAIGSAVCNVPIELDEKQRCKPSVLATIMTLDDGEAELLLDSGDELNVRTCSLIPVPSKERYMRAYTELILRGIYFLLKQERGTLRMAWRWASVVLRLYARDLDEKESKSVAYNGPCVDAEMAFQAHMYKARALVLALKYNAAAASIRAAVFLKPQDKTARQMVSIIRQRKKKQKTENKKLVKEIARWVQHSLEESKRIEGEIDK